MGVTVNTERLRAELVRRGWRGSDLARAARLSRPTVTALLAGHAVSPTTVGLVARALADAPVIEGIDGLL